MRAFSLAGVGFLQGPPHIYCCHTEEQLTWWWGEPDARRDIGILKTSVKGVEGIFSPFNAHSQVSPCCSECKCITRPERRVPCFQKRTDPCIQPGFLFGMDGDFSAGGHIVNTITDVADDR